MILILMYIGYECLSFVLIMFVIYVSCCNTMNRWVCSCIQYLPIYIIYFISSFTLFSHLSVFFTVKFLVSYFLFCFYHKTVKKNKSSGAKQEVHFGIDGWSLILCPTLSRLTLLRRIDFGNWVEERAFRPSQKPFQ